MLGNLVQVIQEQRAESAEVACDASIPRGFAQIYLGSEILRSMNFYNESKIPSL